MKEIQLKRGGTALVDDDDFEFLSKWAWTVDDDGYPTRYYKDEQKKLKSVKMYRVIMKALPGQLVDHEDHNVLNNQRYNLRIATYQTNGMNRVKQKKPSHSRYKGVTLHKRTQRWQSSIGIGASKSKVIGTFDTELQAALAYDFYATHLYGQFACLNKYPEGLAV